MSVSDLTSPVIELQTFRAESGDLITALSGCIVDRQSIITILRETNCVNSCWHSSRHFIFGRQIYYLLSTICVTYKELLL